jgi:hypothetical protein
MNRPPCCCERNKGPSLSKILEDSSRFISYLSILPNFIYRNFVRVSGGPELGAYYHEFFLRDKPQLAAQMFCKNARSKLAMAAISESEPRPAAVVTPAPVVANQTHETPTSAFMEAIRQKVPEQFNNNNNNNNQIKAFPSYGNSTLQLLQRQLDMMQQEQSNKNFELLQQERTRMLLEQASSFQNLLPSAQVQQKQQQQQPNGQAARLLQMQQLMQMQMQQRQVRVSNNPRASAA